MAEIKQHLVTKKSQINAMKKKGYTKVEIAKQLGISLSTLNRIEKSE